MSDIKNFPWGGVDASDVVTVVSDGDSAEVGSTMNITPSDRAMDLRVASDKGVSGTLKVSQPSGLQVEKTVTVTENGETVLTYSHV